MLPSGSLVALLIACCSASSQAVQKPADGLSTFVVQRPAVPDAPRGPTDAAMIALRQKPAGRSVLATSLGVGHVQAAGWGIDVAATGHVAGADVQFESLITAGSRGPRVDRGRLELGSPAGRLYVEAGDLFSSLSGPSRGIRYSVRVSRWLQPYAALHSRGIAKSHSRSPIATAGARMEVGATRFVAEFASNSAGFLRGSLQARRLDVEAFCRAFRGPEPGTDIGGGAEVRIWRSLAVGTGLFRVRRAEQDADWTSVSVRLPIHRHVSLGLERVFTTGEGSRNDTWAGQLQVSRGSWMSIQRYQSSRTALPGFDGSAEVERDRLSSMMAFSGRRVTINFQSATQWTVAGRPERWTEVDVTARLTRSTLVQAASPLPGDFDANRLRVRVAQQLPNRFTLVGEFGRPSSYQPVQDARERSRYRIALQKALDIRTPAGGGSVEGAVVDYIGRPVAGARVMLGPYSTESVDDGRFSFSHVPAGEYDVAIDPDFLPTDYAWDGRTRILRVTGRERHRVQLSVVPLNSIHGRVYADTNANGRFDDGEAVRNAVVRLGDRVTSSDSTGAYDFFNVAPGGHVMRLDTALLPPGLAVTSGASLTIELKDDSPVRGADFVVSVVVKGIIWREQK